MFYAFQHAYKPHASDRCKPYIGHVYVFHHKRDRDLFVAADNTAEAIDNKTARQCLIDYLKRRNHWTPDVDKMDMYGLVNKYLRGD